MIDDRVIDCIAAQAGVKKADVKPEHALEGLDLDSLDRVELVMALEDEFAVMIDDEDADKCVTVADMIALVRQRLAGSISGHPV